MPRVLVVSGYYNRKPLLARTVRSILDQSFADIELIVFDDASTDGSAEELARLSAQLDDPRFRFTVHSENKGFTQGLIDAINATDSEFIAIQGSGDISHPTRLARQIALLESDPRLGAVGCWYRNVDEHSGATTVKRHDDAAAARGAFSHGEVMFRRDAYSRAGGYRAEFRSAQLSDLRLRMAEFATFGSVPEVLYDRYLLSDGVTLNPRRTVEQARYLYLAEHLRTISPGEERETVQLLAEEGVERVVPLDTPAVQRRLVRVTRSMLAHGRRADALALTAQLTSGRTRAVNRLLVRVATLPLASSGLRAVLTARRTIRRRLRRGR